MTRLADYADRFGDIRMERTDGVLLVTFHTDGGSLRLSERSHRELGDAFAAIAADRDSRVVVLTGTGPDFLTEFDFAKRTETAADWDRVAFEGRRLIFNLMDIEVPVIAAVNGPATLHAEIALLSDVVVASETATFQDKAHVPRGTVPGDGVHVVWPLLLGPNRGRYFLLTGQTLTAHEALELGVVGEVLPPDEVLPRALALAAQLAASTPMTLRHTRMCLTMALKRQLHDMLGYGLALEGLAIVDRQQAARDAGAPG